MWLTAMAPAAMAQGDQPAPEMELSVKPRLCIIDDRTPACDISFLVSWESNRAGDYCLFNSHLEQPLLCWQEQTDGEYADGRVLRSELQYWMTDVQTEAQLATVTVEVLRVDDDDRRRRRRSRHVWDVL